MTKYKPGIIDNQDPKHSFLTMGERGLAMNISVDSEVLEDELWHMMPLDEITDRSGKRGATNVVINPDWIELGSMIKYFNAQQQMLRPGKRTNLTQFVEEIDVFDDSWSKRVVEFSDPFMNSASEQQDLYLVAFHDSRPVGFVKMEPRIDQYEDGQVALEVALDMIYVSPQMRGKGFGLDLSVAAGKLIQELAHQTHEKLSEEQTLFVELKCKPTNKNGKLFLEHLDLVISVSLEEMAENPDRKGAIEQYHMAYTSRKFINVP